jgi:hypothetical protein
VFPTASHKDNKAVPAFRFFSFEEDEKQAQEGRRREKLSSGAPF